MRRAIQLSLTAALTLLSSCSRETDEQRAHREVRAAAETFCTHLTNSRVAQYVDGLCGSADMPAELRAQLQDAAAEFAAQLVRTGGGVARVEATRDSLWGDSALVFLEVTFADSVRETILLPMVRRDGEWKMQ